MNLIKYEIGFDLENQDYRKLCISKIDRNSVDEKYISYNLEDNLILLPQVQPVTIINYEDMEIAYDAGIIKAICYLPEEEEIPQKLHNALESEMQRALLTFVADMRHKYDVAYDYIESRFCPSEV